MEKKDSGLARENLASRLGFILISAGCAIGIGNVWKFPYLCGQNGGGAFVLLYIFFLVVLGIPVMTMEFAMGRAAGKSPVRLYQALEKKTGKWHLHGYAAFAGNVLLMMFYTTVAAWMLIYFFKFALGNFSSLTPEAVKNEFSLMLSNPLLLTGAMAFIVVSGFFVCSRGLQNGLERVTKVMMLSLFAIMILLALNSIFLKRGRAGLSFYLIPSMERIQNIGFLKVVAAAMNQAFFTLSLGVGAMAIFGSYINKDRALFGEALNVAALDTFVALTSGLIIFPACFAFGIEADAGPSLIFITLPNIFNKMFLGRLWGSLFFVFMTFASYSTVLAVFENIMACTMELTLWSRKKTAVIDALLVFLLSLPCTLGWSLLSFIEPLGKGTSFLDLEDFIVSNILLPLGSLVFVLFCVLNKGWGWKNFCLEANTGKGLKVKNWVRPFATFLLPAIIILIFILNIWDFVH